MASEIMDILKSEDSDGNPLSEKDAEEKFIVWYNGVCEERLDMLAAEEAYKRRVKELEDCLSNLLEGFENAERELKYLRNKYEVNEEGEVYQEPYDVVFKERENLKEDESRTKKMIKALQDENESLKDYAKHILTERLTQSSMDFKEFVANQAFFTDVEREKSSENDFSEYSSSPRYVNVSNTSSNTTESSMKNKIPLRLDNRRNVLHTPNTDVVAESKSLARIANENTESDHAIFNENGSQVYTRRNILNYRNEVHALLDERYKIEERLAEERYSKARKNENETRTTNRYGDGVLNATPHSLKYKTVMKRLEKGLVVITSAERMEALEKENTKLKDQLDGLEKERNILLTNINKFRYGTLAPLDNSRDKSKSRRSVHRAPKIPVRQSLVRVPKLGATDETFMRRQLSRESSPVSLPSIDSYRSAHQDRMVTFRKTPTRHKSFNDGYLTLLRNYKYK